MKLLRRALLLFLCLALLGSVWLMYINTTVALHAHDSFYLFKWPWLRDVREGSIFGILAWCILFARNETTFLRLGLIAIMLAFAMMQWNSWHPARTLSAEKAKILDNVVR